jgi:hypothetical protein
MDARELVVLPLYYSGPRIDHGSHKVKSRKMEEEIPKVEENNQREEGQPRTFKTLVNTPFKKVMFGVQILSYVLIVASPVIGGAIGGLMHLSAAKTGGLILGVFIAGEVLFYGSLIFLGKEIVLLVRDKARGWFKKKR